MVQMEVLVVRPFNKASLKNSNTVTLRKAIL